MSGPVGSKKFTIKPFRPYCQMDVATAKETWRSLSMAVSKIYNRNASVLSFEELYRNAYNLVLHKHGDLLYDGIQGMIEARLNSVAEIVAASPNERLLGTICEQWKEHQVTMVMVRDILMYMDRTLDFRYVPQKKKMPIYKSGLLIFREVIVHHELVRDRLRMILLKNIQEERFGHLIDQNCMKSALYMLVDLGVDSNTVYEQDFETPFLQETRHFYRRESLAFLCQNTCRDYLKKVESRLSEEMARVPNYLYMTTRPKLQLIMDSELISAHAQAIIESEHSGFCTLLGQSEDRIVDLARMYDLFFRVPLTLNLLRAALYKHVQNVGRLLVNDEAKVKDPAAFLCSLLQLQNKYNGVVRDAFRGEKFAEKKLKEAFESFINSNTHCASCLVFYIDELMRSGFRGATEQEVELEMDRIIAVFRYIHDKDIFEVLYKQHLAKRLLNQRSASSEAERQMLAKLKGECGYQYTTKLEGMFADMKFSRDVTERYRASKEATPSVGSNTFHIVGHSDNQIDSYGRKASQTCDVDVTMLTAGYWPMRCVRACLLPPEATASAGLFEEFYLKQHSGRKLTWVTSCGTVELKALLSTQARHELTVSTYQMCILFLFNSIKDNVELSFLDIETATGIPEKELRRHLVSLCTPKHRILLKSVKGKHFTETCSFKINTEFASKLKRIRVPLVAMKEVNDRSIESRMHITIEEDRRHLCEATIVRIMKARKHAKHNDLIAEVTRQLTPRFIPNSQFIKKSIESLLEREYLERNAKDARLYTYLA